MYKNLRLLTLIFLSFLPSQSFAEEIVAHSFFDRSDDIDPWKVDFRFSGTISSADEEFTSNGSPASAPTGGITPVQGNAFGFNVELERFITDYVSLSIASGYEARKSYNITASSNAVQANTTSGKLNTIPFDFAVNLYPAPYGYVTPFIGIGYNYSVMESTFDAIKTSDANGMLFRAGFDWLINDELSFNFDVKKKFLTIDNDYSQLFGQDYKSTIDLNPIVISAGIGYRF